jgi:predicted dehydrogenase
MGTVDNEYYAAALVLFGADGHGAGAVGTIEASRVIVGPACGYQIEVYGTDGSLKWDFERMNELQVRIGRAADEPGYVTVNANPNHGDYSRFQPAPGNAMGFDDLKTIQKPQSGAVGRELNVTMRSPPIAPAEEKPHRAEGNRTLPAQASRITAG